MAHNYRLLANDPNEVSRGEAATFAANSGVLVVNPEKTLRENQRQNAIDILQDILRTSPGDLRNVLHDTLELLRTA